jgi:hypothetical protein
MGDNESAGLQTMGGDVSSPHDSSSQTEEVMTVLGKFFLRWMVEDQEDCRKCAMHFLSLE